VHVPSGEPMWQDDWIFGPFQTYSIRNTCIFLRTCTHSCKCVFLLNPFPLFHPPTLYTHPPFILDVKIFSISSSSIHNCSYDSLLGFGSLNGFSFLFSLDFHQSETLQNSPYIFQCVSIHFEPCP
jgi:hypothetical protein